MNRNYDPLSRYPYTDGIVRDKIIRHMDEREIKYIIDYSISPDEFMEFIDNYSFNAYNISYYNTAKRYLYNLNSSQVVTVVEKMLKKNLNFEETLNYYMYLSYDEIMEKLNK